MNYIHEPRYKDPVISAALTGWESAVAQLSDFERAEIEICLEKLNELLDSYRASMALAIAKASMQIQLQEIGRRHINDESPH